MKYNIITYLIGEGFSNVLKNKKQATTTFITMGLIMLLFGFCLIVVGNFNYFIKQIEERQGLRVYIDKEATEEDIDEIGKQIKEINGVNTIEYISREEALQQVKEQFGKNANLLDGYPEEVFPVSYKISLTDLEKFSEVKSEISKIEKIENISNDDEAKAKLIMISKAIKTGSYVIIIALVCIGVFIISNTIKLTVYARRKEISIMKYVGATNSFIRWPFAIEGIIIGLIAGTISLIIISNIYIFIAKWQALANGLAQIGLVLLNFSEMFNLIFIVYLVLGVGMGIAGSMLSMKKYLKV